MSKITIIGAGNVGSQVAVFMALKSLGDIVLLDIEEGLAKAKALDIQQSMAAINTQVNIIGGRDFELTKGSDLVIITAGLKRMPGMERKDLLDMNSKIIKSIVPQVIKYSPDSVLLIVTNPMDVMAHLVYILSSFPKNRVIGFGGVLDTARFKHSISRELNISPNKIDAIVIGAHGRYMLPLVNHCLVSGEPLTNLLPSHKLDSIVDEVIKGGEQIVLLSKTSSAYFAPAISIVEMAKSILLDQKKVFPCSVLLNGEYGVDNVFVGVPAILGKAGVEKIITLELNEAEKVSFRQSVEDIRSMISIINQ